MNEKKKNKKKKKKLKAVHLSSPNPLFFLVPSWSQLDVNLKVHQNSFKLKTTISDSKRYLSF
jgi:hypothetical protein